MRHVDNFPILSTTLSRQPSVTSEEVSSKDGSGFPKPTRSKFEEACCRSAVILLASLSRTVG